MKFGHLLLVAAASRMFVLAPAAEPEKITRETIDEVLNRPRIEAKTRFLEKLRKARKEHHAVLPEWVTFIETEGLGQDITLADIQSAQPDARIGEKNGHPIATIRFEPGHNLDGSKEQVREDIANRPRKQWLLVLEFDPASKLVQSWGLTMDAAQ